MFSLHTLEEVSIAACRIRFPIRSWPANSNFQRGPSRSRTARSWRWRFAGRASRALKRWRPRDRGALGRSRSGRSQRRRHRAGRSLLHLQQQRLRLESPRRLLRSRRYRHWSDPARRLRDGLHRPGRPRQRGDHHPLHALRGPASVRPQRPGLRQRRRTVVHGSRQVPRLRRRPLRSLLRQARRLDDPARALPLARAQRNRTLPRRGHPLRGRDAHRACGPIP